MAVTSVTEYAKGRQSGNGQPDRLWARRPFIVLTNNPHDDRTKVEVASDPSTGLAIPRKYEPYQTASVFDPRLVVRNVIASQRDNSRTTWDVMVEYDSEFEVRDDPFSEPPDIRFESEHYQQPLAGKPAVSYDPESQSPQDDNTDDGAFVYREENGAFGKGIVTSAGEPFDPPHTIDASRPIVRFTRNEPNMFIAFKVLFENSVNQDVWSGLQPRQAFLKSMTGQSHKHESTTVGQPPIYYARVEYVFAIKAETWDLQLLDIGSYYLKWVAATAYKQNFRTATGEPRLGLLDNSNADEPGSKLADGAAAQFRRWRAYRENSFAQLGINLDLALEFRRAAPRG